MNEEGRAGPEKSAGPIPEPRFAHLYRLTTPLGLWEHADHSSPRPEHGFCTDDNARGLIVLLREESDRAQMREMEGVFSRFIRDAAVADGGFHNRRRADGVWTDRIGSDDSQGRAIWALGSCVLRSSVPSMRSEAMDLLEQQSFESTSPRANAFVVLGAREVLEVEPANTMAAGLLENSAAHLHMRHEPSWPWPEARLAYENARIPEAMIAAGEFLQDERMTESGLSLLRWLVATEKRSNQFSFTPVGGWSRGEKRPGFDQQPTEAAATADACARAWSITGATSWLDEVIRAGQWLMGANDTRTILYNIDTGACYDGLTELGPNLNQGAESTLAALSTLQQANKAKRWLESFSDGDAGALVGVGESP